MECSWEAFRLVHLPDLDQEAAAGELGEWARRHGVEVEFAARTVAIGTLRRQVIMVLFTIR